MSARVKSYNLLMSMFFALATYDINLMPWMALIICTLWLVNTVKHIWRDHKLFKTHNYPSWEQVVSHLSLFLLIYAHARAHTREHKCVNIHSAQGPKVCQPQYLGGCMSAPNVWIKNSFKQLLKFSVLTKKKCSKHFIFLYQTVVEIYAFYANCYEI